MEWEILSHAKKGALFVPIAVPDHPSWLYTGLCPGSIKIKYDRIKIKYDISYIYHIETGRQSKDILPFKKWSQLR